MSFRHHASTFAARRLQAAVICFFGLCLGVAPHAQGTGTISGRVTDAQTRLALGGARVSVVGTSLATFADPAGNYTLGGVPTGAQTLEFSYVGYADLRQPVSVNAAGATTLNATFGENGDAVRLEKFVIEGSLVGSARHHQQRSAATLRSSVAADEVGASTNRTPRNRCHGCLASRSIAIKARAVSSISAG